MSRPKILFEGDGAPIDQKRYRVMDETGTVWMLVRRESDRLGKPVGVMYHMELTEQELWDFIVRTEFYGTGWTKKRLTADGWRAEQVVICVEEQL